MKNVKIIIRHYTEGVEIFFDGEKKETKANILTEDYTCNFSVDEGVHFFRLKKEDVTSKKHWKRGVLIHWISLLLTVPDFSMDTVCNGAYRADCSYKIDVAADCEIIIDVGYKDIAVSASDCQCIALEKNVSVDETSLKKIRRAYIIPFSIVVGALCGAFLLLAAVSFMHRNIFAGSVVTLIAILIGGIYVYCMKKFLR